MIKHVRSGGPVRVAVLGLGHAAGAHLEAFKEIPHAVEVTGICDVDAEQEIDRCNDYGHASASYLDILRDPRVDCVLLCLPHHLHEYFSITTLAAGKHVVCEKPLGRTVAECQRMRTAALQYGRSIWPVHNRVFSGAVDKMAQMIQAGVIGNIVAVDARGLEGPFVAERATQWLKGAQAGGGVLMAQDIHHIYQLEWLIGRIISVNCVIGKRNVPAMHGEDTAAATLFFDNGVVGTLAGTFALKGRTKPQVDHRIHVYGDEGELTVRLARKSVDRHEDLLWRPGGREERIVPLEAEPYRRAFVRMWEDYAARMSGSELPIFTAGDAHPRASASTALSAVGVVGAMYAAAHERKQIDVARFISSQLEGAGLDL